jgi:hypothetical protein
MAQEGFEPSASLGLSESGLPVAYRAGIGRIVSRNREFRGLESNQRPPRSERGVATSRNCPGVREGGLEPPPPGSKPGSLPVSQFPSRLRSRVRMRVRHARVELACPVWETGAWAARPMTHGAEGEGVEPPRLALARVRAGCRRQSACPSINQHSTGGRNRTCGLLINSEAHEPAHASPVEEIHRRNRVGAAGIEPAVSCSQGRRIPAFPHPVESAQRESNPHIRHGKAVGCRYIMGTKSRCRIVKESESTGWDSNPRRRDTSAVSWPLDHRCDAAIGIDRTTIGTRGSRTLTVLVKSQRLCR